MRQAGFLLSCALALAGTVHAQDSKPHWAFTASAFLYPSDDPSFLLPIATADRGALHLEARYNYEDLETGSGWLGWTLETGDELTLAVTPMIGVVVGRIDGAAPGLEFTLGWRKFELYGEAEYVISFETSADNFLQTWTQATWSPLHWWSVGVSGQRLRSVGSERIIDFGPMAVFRLGPVALQAFAYNPFSDEFYGVLGAGIEF